MNAGKLLISRRFLMARILDATCHQANRRLDAPLFRRERSTPRPTSASLFASPSSFAIGHISLVETILLGSSKRHDSGSTGGCKGRQTVFCALVRDSRGHRNRVIVHISQRVRRCLLLHWQPRDHANGDALWSYHRCRVGRILRVSGLRTDACDERCGESRTT